MGSPGMIHNQFPGHGCMDDLTTERDFALKDMCVIDVLGLVQKLNVCTVVLRHIRRMIYFPTIEARLNALIFQQQSHCLLLNPLLVFIQHHMTRNYYVFAFPISGSVIFTCMNNRKVMFLLNVRACILLYFTVFYFILQQDKRYKCTKYCREQKNIVCNKS